MLTGQNSTTLLLNNIVDSDTSIYVAKIWTLTDTIYSDTARLIINRKTIISIQPQLTNVCYKTAAKIKALASGGGILNYQWYKNGLKLTGQKKDSLCFE